MKKYIVLENKTFIMVEEGKYKYGIEVGEEESFYVGF